MDEDFGGEETAVVAVAHAEAVGAHVFHDEEIADF